MDTSPERTPFDEMMCDLLGRVLALEELVITLFASHARMNPTGVAAQALADPDYT
jgi:hypothetical protein